MESANSSEKPSATSISRHEKPPSGLLPRLKRFPLFHILLFISFMLSSIFINFCQLVLWLTVRPLSLDTFRRWNKYLNYAVWSQVTFLLEWWSNMKIIMDSTTQAHKIVGGRNGLILMNHSHGIDGQVAWAICDNYGILGNAKVLAKKELLFAPVVGWTWFFAEVLFMERDWSRDQVVLNERIESLCAWPEPFWLLLYPEGTRFTKAKHANAVEFARENGLPTLQNLLLPRTKGFVFLRQRIHSAVKDIYDVLMVVGADKPSPNHVNIASVLRGEPSTCRVFMRHYSMDEVPEDEEGAKQWIMDRFVEKDALYSHFKQHGEFVTEKQKLEDDIVPVELQRTWPCLLNTVFWFGAVHSLLGRYLLLSLADGSYLLPGSFVLFLFVASYAMNRMMKLTSVKQSSSSYGAKPSPSKTNVTSKRESSTESVTNNARSDGAALVSENVANNAQIEVQ